MDTNLPALRDLKDILGTLKIENSQRKRNKEMINFFLDFVKDEFIKQGFGEMFKEIIYTGSFYENLRIDSATEFDINIVLDFPFKGSNVAFNRATLREDSVYTKCQLTVPLENCFPSYFTLQMKKIYRSFFDDDNYLIPQNVRKWFQSVIDKMSFNDLSVMKLLKRSESGPARTISIKLIDGTVIDIDLVPVFKFQKCHGYYPEGLHVRQNISQILTNECYDWILVPKPYKASYNSCYQDRFLWRKHMYHAEKHIISRNDCCLKPVTRLMKALRDTQNWSCLCSYFIKTVALLKFEQKFNNYDYWVEKNMPQVFMDMLKLLLDCLRTKRLECFFFPKHNLFSNINPSTLENYYYTLAKIIKKISIEPEKYLIQSRPSLLDYVQPESHWQQGMIQQLYQAEQQDNQSSLGKKLLGLIALGTLGLMWFNAKLEKEK